MSAQRRVACLLAPDFLVQAERRAHPELAGRPFVVATGDDGRAEIVAVSEAAARAGVRAAQTVARARAACAGLVVRPASAALEQSARQSLLDAALALAPRAELAPREAPPFAAEAAVFVDATGTATLYASENGFASALVARAGALGLAGFVGVASSRFAARGVARRLAAAARGAAHAEARASGFLALRPDEEARAIAALPVDLLAPSDALAQRLTRLGIRRVGDLLRLPRRALAQRLGPEARALAARARGEHDEPPLPAPRDARLEEACDLEAPIDRLEPLRFALRGLAARLAERLAVRGLATRRLELALALEGRARDARRIGLAAPTLDVRVWMRVLAGELEASPPRAPVLAVALATEGEAVRRDQLDLFRPRGPDPSALDATLAELEALCGRERVGAPRVADVHRPDAWALAPFAPRAAEARAAGGPVDTARIGGERGTDARPPLAAVRALRPPVPARVRVDAGAPVAVASAVTSGEVVHASGPWRSTGGWWSEGERYALDHYDVQVSDGVVARLCFDWTARRWSVDGVYD